MAQKNKSDPVNKEKPLSREEILDHEETLKSIQLPSGINVQVNYLAYFLVLKIQESIDSDSDKNKEKRFSQSVVRLLLRDNDIQDLNSFTEDDQKWLIEIAAEEWGCKEEYDQLIDIDLPEERLYQAVKDKSQKFSRQLSESLRQLTSRVLGPQIASFNWLGEYQNSLQIMMDQMGKVATAQISDVLGGLDISVFDQFSHIGQMIGPITQFADEMEAIRKATILPYEESLAESLGELFTSYHALMKESVSFNNFTSYPKVVRYYPTVEMHNTSVIAGRLFESKYDEVWEDEIITPESDDLVAWLNRLDDSFPIMIEGAKQAIFSRNPDRCRHFASSHRELCTQIIHMLAPDEEVSEWTSNPSHFHEGRPTRIARLKYILRNHQNNSFIEFFVNDFKCQMDLLNADQHRRSQDYTEKELTLLHDRFLSMLGFLMKINN